LEDVAVFTIVRFSITGGRTGSASRVERCSSIRTRFSTTVS
jgi:hypothetical protein